MSVGDVGLVEVDNEERYIKGPSGNIAEVTSANELKVTTPIPQAPPNTTPVVLYIYEDVSGTSEKTEDYTIPDGKTLYCQKLIGTSEDVDKNTKKQLIVADNSNWDNEVTLAIEFAQRADFDLSDVIVGNGSKIVGLRVERMDNGKRECFLKFYGYLKDTE